MRIIPKLLILAAVFSSSVVLALGAEKNKRPISRLIADLGSDNYAVREKAEKQLRALLEIPPELHKACRSTDAEVRATAKAIVSSIEGRVIPLRLKEIEHFAMNGEFDQAVERAVRWEGLDPAGKNIIPLAKLAAKLREIEKAKFGKMSSVRRHRNMIDMEQRVLNSFPSFKIVSSRNPLVYTESHTAIVRSAGLGAVGPQADGARFLISSGDVLVDNNGVGFTGVMFACGAVKIKGNCGLAIIVVDGDVEIVGPDMGYSLILTSGNVTLPKYYMDYSVILAGGKVQGFKVTKQRKIPESVIIRENYHDGLGIIKFFETKKVGIEVEAGTKGVKVKQVRKGSTFDTKVRTGDEVVAIDGTKTATPNQFRRVLRKALANTGLQMSLSVQRAGKTEQVQINVP